MLQEAFSLVFTSTQRLKHLMPLPLHHPEILAVLTEQAMLTADEFVLRFGTHTEWPVQEMAQQLYCRPRAQRKLPALPTDAMLFDREALEQCSSQWTASYKASLLSGTHGIDLCGGLGIDSAFLSDTFEHWHYNEQQAQRCATAQHNFTTLTKNNITIHNDDGIAVLKQFADDHFDWLYCDPSRRTQDKRTVNLLHYQPDILANAADIFRVAKRVCIKLAPATEPYEIQRLLAPLSKQFHWRAISLAGECKEILVFLSSEYDGPASATLLTHDGTVREYTQTTSDSAEMGIPTQYILIPDPAIIRAGLVDSIAHTHTAQRICGNWLSCTQYPTGFPGRVYTIQTCETFSKKKLHTYCTSISLDKAHLATHGLPVTAADLQRSLRLHNGGDNHLFIYTTADHKKRFIHAKRLETTI